MEHRNLDLDLEKILPKQPPILEHVLHSIYALCLDIQTHSGSRINKGIVNDYRQFNNSLTLVANLLCTIYDAHSAELLEKVQVAFPEDKVRDIEKQTRDTERLILDHKDDLDKLQTAEAALKEKLATEKKLLEDLTSKKDTIEQLQSTLNTTISQIKQIDLPDIYRKLLGGALQGKQSIRDLRGLQSVGKEFCFVEEAVGAPLPEDLVAI